MEIDMAELSSFGSLHQADFSRELGAVGSRNAVNDWESMAVTKTTLADGGGHFNRTFPPPQPLPTTLHCDHAARAAVNPPCCLVHLRPVVSITGRSSTNAMIRSEFPQLRQLKSAEEVGIDRPGRRRRG
jgi:hypothetical protein